MAEQLLNDEGLIQRMEDLVVSNSYVVNYQRMCPELAQYASALGLPDTHAVDKVFADLHYDYHIAPGGQPYINSAHLESFAEMKKREGDNNAFPADADVVTYWASLIYDYGIGKTDTIAFDDCMVDVGERGGRGKGRYMTQYLTVGIPLGSIRYVHSHISKACKYKVDWKAPVHHNNYVWITMGVRSGMAYKALKVETTTNNSIGDDGQPLYPDGVEDRSMEDLTLSGIRYIGKKSLRATVFLSMGVTMRVSSDTVLDEISNTSTGTISSKVIGCHFNLKHTPVDPPSLKGGKVL